MKKALIIFLQIIFVGLITFLFLSIFDEKRTADKFTNTKLTISNTVQPQISSASLSRIIENMLTDKKGAYGIAIKNLQTGESYYLNEHTSFEPGSLYKIWILATAFRQIEDGKLEEDRVLSQEIPILNEKFNISSESAELTEGRITLTVKEAMEKMITISDNYSALLLSERVRLSNVKAFLQENGFDESTLGEPPLSTPYDTALFFEKLSKGELANQQNTQKMLDIFKQQTLNSKLPGYLPENIIVAHKTGEIGFFSHDAGIVYTPNPYIIVVMSKTDSPADADEVIARISQAVYKYFRK